MGIYYKYWNELLGYFWQELFRTIFKIRNYLILLKVIWIYRHNDNRNPVSLLWFSAPTIARLNTILFILLNWPRNISLCQRNHLASSVFIWSKNVLKFWARKSRTHFESRHSVNVEITSLYKKNLYVMLYAIWYHLYNFKKREKRPWWSLKLIHECFSRFLICKNGTKSHKAPHMYQI